MSETKFTNGEWGLFDGDRFQKEKVITTNDRRNNGKDVICEVDVFFDGEHGIEQEANAHLIAAAPEMYKMLENVSSELHMLIDEVNDQRASRITSQTESEPDYHDQQTLHEIQILLAKARGEK